MNLLKKSIALLVLIIFMGCKKTKEIKTETQPVLEEEHITTQKVWLIGKSDDARALHSFNLQDGSVLLSKNHFDKAKVHGDSLKIVLDSIVSSRFLEVAVGGTDCLYHGQVFITPGDTILFEIKNKKISFLGKNANLNNFYTQLYDTTPRYYNNAYKGNLYDYKKTVDSIYKLKKDFFNNYVKIHNVVSKNFIEAVKGDLKHEHLFDLMRPRNINSITEGMYHGEKDGLIPLIKKEFGYGENLFDINYYLNNVTINDFKDVSLLDNSLYFKLNINQFIRYNIDSSTTGSFSKDKLMAEKEFIEKNFEGKMKKFAIARMIRDYEMKGFGYSINNVKVLKSLIKKYESEFIDQSYKNEMIKINKSLDAFNFKLSDAAINITKLISLTGDTLTLNDVFKGSTKRIRVIDFWATWCPPCIDEIKRAKNFKDKLAIEKDVEWIYLSIDKDQDRWKRTSQELSDFLNVRNQYLILGGKKSSLANDLKVNGIPRYVIFNTKNEIVLENAPRPSDTLMYEKIIDHISLRK